MSRGPLKPNAWGARRFALAAGLRAALAGALCLTAVLLLGRTHLYVTALIALALAALVGADLVRLVRAADRRLASFADAIAAGALERPSAPSPTFPELDAALERAIASIESDRSGARRSLDALEALFDTVTAGLIVLRPDGAVAMSNRPARHMAGQSFRRLTDAPALAPLAEPVMGMKAGARGIVRLADGRRVLAAVSGFSAPGAASQRLVSLQIVAEELDIVEVEAWRTLTRVLAHEILNALTAVTSLAESLERLSKSPVGDDGGTARDAEIAGAAEVIARRSAGLISFAERYREAADLPSPQRARLRLADLVGDLDRLVGARLAARGIDYGSAVQPPDLEVFADEALIDRAIVNLLTNAGEAVRHTPDPIIRLLCVRDAEGRTAISVTDNGAGLPDEIDQLFVPFFSTKAGGSGIGLSLVRQIALAHGGIATAARASPRGAVFALVLP